MSETASITLEELHEAAGVPEGSELHTYEWTEDGLNIHYTPSEDLTGTKP